MKNEDLVGTARPAAFLTVRNKRKIVMIRFREERRPVSFIYSFDFRNFVERHKLGAPENLRGTKDYVLANRFWITHSQHDEDQSDHGLFVSKHMKGTDQALGDMMKQLHPTHIFCFIE